MRRTTALQQAETPPGLHRPYRLNLPTLVWTRGGAFPISSLETRLRCPQYGSRQAQCRQEAEPFSFPSLERGLATADAIHIFVLDDLPKVAHINPCAANWASG